MNKLRNYLILIIGIGYFIGYLGLDRWPTTLYFGDSNGYYLHLVSFFINSDVGDYDQTITSLLEASPNTQDPREDKYGIRLTEKGRRYIKYTLGVPLMETPFFWIAHSLAITINQFTADGWALPYRLIVSSAPIFYILIGFYLIIPVLGQYFSLKAILLSVLSVAFATNLFFQATYVTMAHGFLFFDYCLLILLSHKFHKTPNARDALFLGTVVGLITITRVPEIVSIFIPLLWGITDWKTFKSRIDFFARNFRFLLWAGGGFAMLCSIQMVYWYYVSGKVLFNPYQGEGFNFLQPNVWKGWFHFKNGWLIYTPIMVFSLIGLFFLRQYVPKVLLAFGVCLLFHVYIHYSYYAWSYFPGLGQRPMVEMYPLLIFGLTTTFEKLLHSKWSSWLPLSLLLVFGSLNLFQTWQMKAGIIWSERGNQAFYYETFGLTKPTWEALVTFDATEIQPDTNQLETQSILEVISEVPKISEAILPIVGKALTPVYAFPLEPFSVLKQQLSLADAQPGDWIKLELTGFIAPQNQIWNRDQLLRFGGQFVDEAGKVQKEKTIKIASHIGNPSHSIWTTGDPGVWDTAFFYLKVPRKMKNSWRFNLICKNPDQQKLYFSNLRIHVLKPM